MTDDKQPPNPLDALAAQAESLDAASTPENQTDAQPLGMTNAQAIAGAIGAGREAFCFFTKLQSPRQVLTDSAVQQLAELWAPVADKHGINLGEYLGDYALEIAAAIGTISIAAALRSAVNAEIQAQKPAPTQAPEASQVQDAVEA